MVRSGGCGNVTQSRLSLWPVHMIILVKMEAELTGAAELGDETRNTYTLAPPMDCWTSNERLKPFVNDVPSLRITFIRIGA